MIVLEKDNIVIKLVIALAAITVINIKMREILQFYLYFKGIQRPLNLKYNHNNTPKDVIVKNLVV